MSQWTSYLSNWILFEYQTSIIALAIVQGRIYSFTIKPDGVN